MRLQELINSSRSRSTRRGGVVAGCLIALAIVVVIVIIGAVIVALNWKTWAADLTVTGATEAINDSSLPESEKPELIAIIEDFATRFKDGDINTEQFGMTFLAVMSGDVFPIGNAYVADNGYIQASGLTDEEKADGSLQMMRIASGLNDGLIDRADFTAVFAPMVDTTENANFQTPEGDTVEFIIFRDPGTVTDEELKEVIEAARVLADGASITATPAMIDLSDALQAEIDEALGEAPATPAAPETPAMDEGDAPADDATP